MKSATIHHLNTGLIILSCLIAFFVPFELFLFSYGVLGPLHYLTEIGWLHKKNYFTKGKYDFLFLGIACVILVYYNFNPSKKDGDLITNIITFSLFASAVFVFIKDWLYRILLLILAIISVAFINNAPNYFIWFGIFLPTIIHVFVFTWLFMLYGVLKERSWQGLISVIVLILCASTFFVFQPDNLNYAVSGYVQKSYNLFAELNFRLIELFNLQQLNSLGEIYSTNSGFVIMRFIAFAYTYHYLNWFSKTSVIKWHQVPKNVLIGTLVIWVISVALYAIDYTKGLKVLFFLSFLHVFLEFPLNFVSITGIGKELFGLAKAKS